MEQLPFRAQVKPQAPFSKHVEPFIFGCAQVNPQAPFSKHAEPSHARLAGTADNAKLDYSRCTGKHLALIRSSLSGRLQITRALPSKKEHLMRTDCRNFEDNAHENGSIGGIASPDTLNEDHMILTLNNAHGSGSIEGSANSFSKGNADAVKDISLGQGGANHEEPQLRAFEDYHCRQGAASHVKPLLRAFEDFRSKLDLKNWDNRDVGGEVYLDGKHYDMRDPNFIKLRNSNFLKFSSKALAKKYNIDESFLVESLNQSSGRGPVVFESDNDFYRQTDFSTNVDLQQKLASLGGMD